MAAGTMVATGRATAAQIDLLSAAPDRWAIERDRSAGGDSGRLWVDEAGMDLHTGASSIFFLPDAHWPGDYRVEVSITQFDPERRNEGYGLFFFGTDLDGQKRSYTYFLIRQDGATLLKRRVGNRTLVVNDWERSDAVQTWAGRDVGSHSVTNVLVLDVAGTESCLSVNRVVVTCVSHSEVGGSGVVGLRVNHGLRLRIERFEVHRR